MYCYYCLRFSKKWFKNVELKKVGRAVNESKEEFEKKKQEEVYLLYANVIG
jgi:hypothetical protein